MARKEKSAVRILERVTGDDFELRRMIIEEKLNARIARMILEARNDAGLTQKALARKVGTTQSVIARLEDADYGGHSLSMLQRIAEALGQDVAVVFTRRARHRSRGSASSGPPRAAANGRKKRRAAAR